MAIGAMAITDCEEMAVLKARNMWICQIGVLVLFKWVIARNSTLCSKAKLSDHIRDLLFNV